jgi:hypothetical protein
MQSYSDRDFLNNDLTNATIDFSLQNSVTNLTVAMLASAAKTSDLNTSALSTQVATADAIKSYADGLLGANDAMVYKGVIDASGNPNYPAGDAGHTYKISVAGKIGGASGINVEVGDMVICLVDSTVTGDHATVGANWNIIQVNIDGSVVGPASSTDNAIVRFDGVTGKIIQNGLASVDDSGSVNIPTGQAYEINNVDILTADTLGSSVVTSSLTTVGTLSSGNATAVVDAATDALAGKVELATNAETQTGTDATRAVTPAGLASIGYTKYYTSTISNSTGATITAGTHGLTTALFAFVQDASRATHTGTADLSTGYDWATTNQDFSINVNGAGATTVNLITLTTDVATTVTAINAAFTTAGVSGVEAFASGINVGIRTTANGIGQSFVLAAGTTDALVTLGLTAGTYTGTGYNNSLIDTVIDDANQDVTWSVDTVAINGRIIIFGI